MQHAQLRGSGRSQSRGYRQPARGAYHGNGRGGHTQAPALTHNLRDWREGLAATSLGAIDRNTLRFVGAEQGIGQEAQEPLKLPTDTVEVTNVQALGSYNWSGETTHKILIPGSPPVWRDSPMPFHERLPSDSDLYKSSVFVDEGAGSAQDISILAMLAAVQECTGTYHWKTADYVTDRNSLRHLFRWITATPKQREEMDFRIDVHLAGTQTLVLTRWKQNTNQLPYAHSFGFSFEKAETTPAVGLEQTRAAGYDRIISYNLGDLKLVVRYEVDALLPKIPTTSSINDLTDHLSHTNLSDRDNVHHLGSLSYRPGIGRLVPQAQLVELVTRTEKTVVRAYDEIFPQIYLGNTPNLVIAIHEKGWFKRRTHEVLGVDGNLVKAAKAAQTSFKELRVLLGVLQRLAVNHADEQLSILCQQGVLKAFVRRSGTALPGEFLAQFT